MPLTGTSRSITPLRSLSSATASLTGSGDRVLARGLVAEFELVHADVVLGIELAAVDFVVQFGGEFTLGDVVAGEIARIRIEGAEFHVAENSSPNLYKRRAEQIDFADDGHRGKCIHSP